MPTYTATEIPGPIETPRPTTPTALPGFDELVHIFDYDSIKPLDTVMGDVFYKDGVAMRMLSYRDTDRCRALGILVLPEGDGSYPAIIYMHRGQADKSQFLEEAILLAKQDVVSLLLDSSFNAGCGSFSDARQAYIHMVLFARRGVDLLETLPQIDPERIAYVGHSLGATWGGVTAGVEPRLRVIVLMAGYAQVSLHDSPEVPDLDAILYVGHAQDTAFLFQFATNDEFISQEEGQKYFEAASGEKSILWYDSTHISLQEDSQADRLAWLSQQLGFPAP